MNYYFTDPTVVLKDAVTNYHITDSQAMFGTRTQHDVAFDSATVNSSRYVFRHTDEKDPLLGEGELGWHYHNCYELLYFLRGDAEYQIEQSRYTLRPHSLLIIKPGEYHTMIVRSGKRLDRIVIHFGEQDLSPNMQATLSTLSSVFCIPGTRLSDEILLVDKYQQDLMSGVSRDILLNQLQIILAFLCSIQNLSQPADQVDHGAEQIISYIHNNLATIRTLEDICQNVHMSRSTVQNLISDYLQTPVMSYVRTQKCVMAQGLLQKGVSATEAALRCGFADYSSFYRAYRKVFGTAPSRGEQNIRTLLP